MATSNTVEDDEQKRRTRKNDVLKMYYSVASESNQGDGQESLNIDSSQFKTEEYLRKLKQVRDLQ